MILALFLSYDARRRFAPGTLAVQADGIWAMPVPDALVPQAAREGGALRCNTDFVSPLPSLSAIETRASAEALLSFLLECQHIGHISLPWLHECAMHGGHCNKL